MNRPSPLMRVALCAALLLASAGPALAVGTTFTWQGEVRDGGVPASGAYDFEFRLFAVESGGTAIGPVRSLVAQQVTAGLYTALLDFGDQFTGEPRWLEISIRRNGQPAYTPLLPRQPLTATPYAQHADFVADNSIVGANIVDGSVGATDLQPGAVGSNQIANGGVAGIDLADGSVTAPKLADGAVVAAKLASSAVGTVSIADQAVTAAKLAPGAVGAAQIDTAQVQARLLSSCPEGLPLQGIDADGGARCGDRISYFAADLAFATLALGPGQAPLVFGVSPTMDALQFSRCGDAICSDGEYRINLDASVGNSGAVAVVLGSLGNPIVAYHDVPAQAARVAACGQTSCTTSSQFQLEAGGAGPGIDIAMRPNGTPFVAYLVDTGASFTLKAFDCTSDDCSTGTVRTLDSSNVSNDSRVSISVRDGGIPIVFYEGNGASQGLHAYRCFDSACTNGTARDINDDEVFGIDSTARAGRGPFVVYTAGSGGAVRGFDCIDAGCDGGTVRTFSTSSNSAKVAVQQPATGGPVVAYHAASALRVYRCDNSNCATGVESLVASGPELEGSPSMALRSDGRPVVLSEEDDLSGTRRLRVDTCGNVGCAQ
jgi:hypothetical protein